MNTTIKYNLLFDFYGPLLTDRQKEIYQMYYGEDLSLGEIAEQLEISRQAVYDIVKRSSKILADFESKLGLVNKFFVQENLLKEVEQEIISFKQLFKDDLTSSQSLALKNILDLVTKVRTDS